MEKVSALTKDEIATIDNIIKSNGENSGQLVKVLQEIQSQLRYVPLEGQKLIADRLNVPISKVYGIVSFYNFFRLFPPGKHSVTACMGTACYVRGAKDILGEIRKKYKVEPGQTTVDRRFSLEVIRCLGCCAIGPVITVDGKVYGRMKPAKVKEVLEKYN